VLTRLELMRALASLEAALTSREPPLHLTAELLSQEYRDARGVMRVACPGCCKAYVLGLKLNEGRIEAPR
jgi:hypothetical protein